MKILRVFSYDLDSMEYIAIKNPLKIMKNLIIGASGFIGNSLYTLLKKEHKEISGTFHSRMKPELIKLDFTQKSEVASVFKKNLPDCVFLPAFIPGVDYCELNNNPNLINLNGVNNIIGSCRDYGTKLVFYSTDYIFDGKCGPYLEDDKPNPINRYGKTKLLCENKIKELNDYLIIRTTIVYGFDIGSKNFLMTLVNDLKQNHERKIPYDQIGSPTFVEDLAKISIELAEKDKTGIYNVAGPDLCSRFTFTLKIARIFELNETLIIPISTHTLKQPAKRPLRAGLIIDKIRGELNANPQGIDRTIKILKERFPIEPI